MSRIPARGAAPAAAAPAAAGEVAADGAAETTEEGKTKRGRVAKPAHPVVAAGTKLESIPEDYSSKEHAGLKEEDFTDNAVDKFFDWQAKKYEDRAASLRSKANNYRALGGCADRKAGQKLVDTMDQVKALIASLTEGGADLSGIAGIDQFLESPEVETPEAEAKAA